LRILIFGAGRVGSRLAVELSKLGHSITVIDTDEEKLSRLGVQADVEGLVRDATDPQLYEELDLPSYDIVVACTDRDEVNLFVAAIARLYGIERIFVRAKNEQTPTLLQLLGVESVVVEPRLAANIILSMIQGRYGVIDLVLSLSGDYRLVSASVKETSILRGKTVAEAMRAGLIPKGVKILAIFDGENFHEPEEGLTLEVGHVVIALVAQNAVKEFSELF